MSEDCNPFLHSTSMESTLLWVKDTGELVYNHFAKNPVVIGTIDNSEGWKLLMRHIQQLEGFSYCQGVEHAKFDLQETIKQTKDFYETYS